MGNACCGEENPHNGMVGNSVIANRVGAPAPTLANNPTTGIAPVQIGDAPHKVFAEPKTAGNLNPVVQSAITRLKNEAPLKRDNKFTGVENKQTYYIHQKGAYYTGDWKNGKPNGKGTVQYNSGAYFEGEFNDGLAECSDGLFVYPDGTTYRGNVHNSKANGFGKLVNANQTFSYVGNWRDDKPEGQGEEVHADGSKYKGGFVNGLKQGKGKYFWGPVIAGQPNNQVGASRVGNPDDNKDFYEGQFVQGYMEDAGAARQELKSKKETYTGGFKKNKRHGKGELRNSAGLYKGNFIDDMKDDPQGVFEYQDGKVYKGGFAKNLPHGKGTLYFPNGQIVEGTWENGENAHISNITKGNAPETTIGKPAGSTAGTIIGTTVPSSTIAPALDFSKSSFGPNEWNKTGDPWPVTGAGVMIGGSGTPIGGTNPDPFSNVKKAW